DVAKFVVGVEGTCRDGPLEHPGHEGFWVRRRQVWWQCECCERRNTKTRELGLEANRLPAFENDVERIEPVESRCRRTRQLLAKFEDPLRRGLADRDRNASHDRAVQRNSRQKRIDRLKIVC